MGRDIVRHVSPNEKLVSTDYSYDGDGDDINHTSTNIPIARAI